MGFRSFAFISQKKSLRDKFVQCSSNLINIPLQFLYSSNTLCNLLITKSDIPNNFSEVVKAILFEENIGTIGKIWEACNCDNYPPLLITDINLKIYPSLDRESDKYKVIEPPIKINNQDSLIVYQPYDKKAFESISKILISRRSRSASALLRSHKTAFWIPQNTDLKKLQHLLAKTESRETIYSDIFHLQNFFDVSEWIYVYEITKRSN